MPARTSLDLATSARWFTGTAALVIAAGQVASIGRRLRGRRRIRRWAGVVVAAVVVSGVVAPSGVAATAVEQGDADGGLCHLPRSEWPPKVEGPPLLCGRTTFRVEGNAGIEVRVPEVDPAPRLSRENIRLTLEEGTFALFGLVPPVCGSRSPGSLCFRHWGFLNPAFTEFPSIHTTDSARLWNVGEVYELYVISDGVVTLEFEVEGLSGEMDLPVTGAIDAQLERLPRNCPATDCENIGYGGLTHTTGDRAFVGSLAWAVIPSHIPETGIGNMVGATVSAVACIYPNGAFPDGSPDPDDHPQGCDLVPNENDPNSGWLFIGRAAVTVATGYEHFVYNTTGAGRRYAGYTAEMVSPLVEGGSYGGWGMWINGGIACPSGNYLNCDT